VLRAGVVDVLVVDEGNAHAVLDLARPGRPDETEPARPSVRPHEEVIGRTVSAA
jgi:hypothetical protein